MGFHKKIVAVITLFVAGVSCVFLISGAGVPALRVMVFVLFSICVLNLSVYWREFGRWIRKTAHTAGENLTEARQDLANRRQAKQTLKNKENKTAEKPRGRRKEEPVRAKKAAPVDDFTDEDFEEVDEEEFEFEDDDR